MKNIHVIGAACSAGATTRGCERGPNIIRKSSLIKALNLPLEWKAVLHTNHDNDGLDAMHHIAEYCENVAMLTQKAVSQNDYFLTIGGDHSCAVGTWSGAANAMRDQGPIGLIWVDAHIDAHTPDTSETGNIHGMPVAHLLGQGASELCHIGTDTTKILPQNLCLIGIRSFETGEKTLVEKLGVKVYYIEEVIERGIDAVLKEAHAHVTKNTAGFGFSIDLDGFDPSDAPAVGTPVEQGVDAQAFLKTFRALPKDKMIGCEIAEFNPEFDVNHQSEKLVADLISAAFEDLTVKKSNNNREAEYA
jgi:arginase